MLTTRVQYQKGVLAIERIISDEVEKATLDQAILDYEPVFLQRAFGYEFFRDLMAYVNDDNHTANPIYDNLLNGVEFIDSCGNLQKTEPLKYCTARYVFFEYKNETLTKNTTSGEMVFKTENADAVAPANRLVQVWNELAMAMVKIYDYIQKNRVDYPTIYNYGGDESLIKKINHYGI